MSCSDNNFANCNQFAKLLFFIVYFTSSLNHSVFCQDSLKPVNFSSKLKLEKYFTIHYPSNLELSTLKIKTKDGKIYLLNDNFINGKGLVLFAVDIRTNKYDTNYINLEEYSINIADFDICDQKLYLSIGNSITIYDLTRKKHKNIELKFPNKSTYRHFYVADSVNILFYEWQIGDLKLEEKYIYKYHLNSNQWEVVDQNQIDGLGFLGTYNADKHLDLNSNMLAKFKPDRYKISTFNFKTGRRDTIIRNFDTNLYISGDVIRNIHDRYRMHAKSSLFDSLDKHCFNHARLNSLRISGDSIMYVFYSYKSENCLTNSKEVKFSEYLDIWKYNSLLRSWGLHIGNLKLNNRADCIKRDLSQLVNIYYTLLGVERHWCVYENYLIIPKKMPDTIDLGGDISPYYKRENYNGGLNLQLMVFKLPFGIY